MSIKEYFQEWIVHFDDYIKDCRKEVKKQRINLVASHIAPIFFAVAIVMVISLVVFFVQPKFSGFSVDEPDSEQRKETNGQRLLLQAGSIVFVYYRIVKYYLVKNFVWIIFLSFLIHSSI